LTVANPDCRGRLPGIRQRRLYREFDRGGFLTTLEIARLPQRFA
jgi:hypothetical protein